MTEHIERKCYVWKFHIVYSGVIAWYIADST